MTVEVDTKNFISREELARLGVPLKFRVGDCAYLFAEFFTCSKAGGIKGETDCVFKKYAYDKCRGDLFVKRLNARKLEKANSLEKQAIAELE